ncbi:MAG: DUF3800 domain-containing protein [Patescibacteria group bacterium]
MAHIFIDESGQFVKHNHEEYFVVASFTVGDPRRTDKQFKVWQHNHFPRKLRHQAEIKFSEVKITDTLRLKTLQQISRLDVRIRYTYLRRENIPDTFRKDEKVSSGELYTQVIGETLEMYLPTSEQEFRVFCDRRHLKGSTEGQFRSTLTARILPNLPAQSIVQIQMIDSTTNRNIQIADWIAGALARYLEKKPLGTDGYSILKNNIIGEGKELFPHSPLADNQKTQPIG